ncbi:MAG: hypothetical protein IPL55_12915 [Saprospiraceae bacterium]|jgi:hypothetical protein|nr:hypothetical protein [Saprospiraceae bacterium]
MQQIKSILLLFIMGIILFPWQMICLAHPLGHEHHHHDGPSPCELHRIAAQQGGQHILPPMECNHILSAIDDLQQPQVEKIVPTFHTLIVFAVLFDFVNFDNKEQPFLFPPDPQCRSATLISDNPLRGPPLV